MLSSVRERLMRSYGPKIRIILTGRPSDIIYDANFLRDITPILTIRNFNPQQLQDYANNLSHSTRKQNITSINNIWHMPDRDKIREIIRQYRNDIKNMQPKLEVLGLPLLAYLSFRMMGNWNGILDELIENRTTLLRNLVDIVCPHAANLQDNAPESNSRFRFAGNELRALLRDTAAAMTICGSENISYYELEQRLQVLSITYKKHIKELSANTERFEKDHPLSKLMIAFYFKGGKRDQGCEFMHKSFREYLYSEAIVEILKEYGRKLESVEPVIPEEQFWFDFDISDSRYNFSRQLCRLIGNQWLTPEITEHLRLQIGWEINRSILDKSESNELLSISLDKWEIVRDTLADLWSWWAAGAHLRPQLDPKRPNNRRPGEPPYSLTLIDWGMPQYLSPDDQAPIKSSRTTTIDAFLGDALFRINAILHHEIMVVKGWGPNKSIVNKDIQQNTHRKNQSIYQGNYVTFRPSINERYLRNYISRINGLNSAGEFPAFTHIPGIDLSNMHLHLLLFSLSNLKGANLTKSNLTYSYLYKANLIGANLSRSNLYHANLEHAKLENADLTGAILQNANMANVNLTSAILTGADLTGADLTGAILQDASLDYATLKNVNVTNARFAGADLRGAIIKGAKGLDLTGVDPNKLPNNKNS